LFNESWKFVNIYHEFLKSNLLWRHISSKKGNVSPQTCRHTDKYFSPRFFRIRENEEKKTLVKRIIELWELLRCILTKWAKKEMKERKKNSKQNLWILIDMKKRKRVLKLEKKQATMIHNCVANKFFCILFSFKKMTPHGNFI